MRRYLALIVFVNIAICGYGQTAKKAELSPINLKKAAWMIIH
jgi:hypothetical protein